MTPSTVRAQTQSMEGIAVVGEAVRRVAPESTQFLIEVTAAAHTPAQALRDHQTKTTQIAQAVAALGSQKAEVQTISMNVVNTFAPLMQALPHYAVPPQIGPTLGGLQPDVQFGTYQARSLQRVTVREPARAGEVADAVTKAGGTLVSGFSYHAADEAAARWAALEAAGRDARAKAEALATASGREIGEPINIFEDIVASNGVYAALRAQAPLAFGPGSPAIAGELEYYARVTASFRFVQQAGRVTGETR